VNVAINQLPDASSLAHEVTHAFGIGHNACGAQSAGGTPDPSLPCSIEDVGWTLQRASFTVQAPALRTSCPRPAESSRPSCSGSVSSM
jgi:hypothetical protein